MGTTESHDPERSLERSADELEERIEQLDDHIHAAERKAEDRPLGPAEDREAADDDRAGAA